MSWSADSSPRPRTASSRLSLNLVTPRGSSCGGRGCASGGRRAERTNSIAPFATSASATTVSMATRNASANTRSCRPPLGRERYLICLACRVLAGAGRSPLSLPELADLVSRAAAVHVAPAAAVILRAIDEQPCARVVRAFAEKRALPLARQNHARRPRDRPDHTREVVGLGPKPLEPRRGLHDPRVRERIRGLRAEQFDVLASRFLLMRDARERAPDRVAERDRALEHVRRLHRIALRPGEQRLRVGRAQRVGQPQDFDDVRVRLKVLVTGSLVEPAASVREVGGEIAADVFKRVIESRRNVLHLTIETA